MGSFCSRSHLQDDVRDPEHRNSRSSQPHKPSQGLRRPIAPVGPILPSSQHKRHQTAGKMHPQLLLLGEDAARDMNAGRRAVCVQDEAIAALDPTSTPCEWGTDHSTTGFDSIQQYLDSRISVLRSEKTFDFDFSCRARATHLEHRVDAIIHELRRQDEETVYAAANPRRDLSGQLHQRFPGDHFLSNAELIHSTALFDVACRLPKGAHLHIHFNSCLLPHVLLDIAKTMKHMYITSDLPLIPYNNFENYDKCEIRFSILGSQEERPGDPFSYAYRPRETMKLGEFLQRFPRENPAVEVDSWLVNKIVFHENEAYDSLQTAAGAWEKFNARTRMMKGLFNYVTAYREYTRLCLEDFMRDNIQYAEIRPNFMSSNQLYLDDGSGTIDNWGLMEIIIDVVQQFKVDMANKGRFFGGLKVIYCAPRSFSNDAVKVSLDECIALKKRWPEWIAGFDLVGEETLGSPLKEFVPELLAFRKECDAAGLDLPFLFHCGETLEMGADTDYNLVDALLLGSKRIGHGFALPKHPYIMQQMKAQGICVELCPISNEILGLTPRVSGHTMYELLSNNVHCTVNTDNGTLFRSTLSDDFYQVMMGKSDMGLFGWKQLVLWSIEHACLSPDEKALILENWYEMWLRFLNEIIDTYGDVVEQARRKQ